MTGSGFQPAIFRAKGAIYIQFLPVHLLYGPTAEVQALGQFPLAHIHRALNQDVLPLLLGLNGVPYKRTSLRPAPPQRDHPPSGSYQWKWPLFSMVPASKAWEFKRTRVISEDLRSGLMVTGR